MRILEPKPFSLIWSTVEPGTKWRSDVAYPTNAIVYFPTNTPTGATSFRAKHPTVAPSPQPLINGLSSATWEAIGPVLMWRPQDTYDIGTVVYHPVPNDNNFELLHRFESVQGSQGHAPVMNSTEYWIDLGPVNSMAMFDGRTNRRTKGGSDIQVALTASHPIRQVVVLGMQGVRNFSIQVRDIQTGGLIVNQSSGRQTTPYPIGWYSWLFAQYAERATQIVPVPPWVGGLGVEIVLAFSGSQVQVGNILTCTEHEVGRTDWGASPGYRGFSTFEADEFGHVTFTPRQAQQDTSYTVWVSTHEVDRIYALCMSLDRRLAVFDGNNEYDDPFDSLIVYGKLESFRTGLSYEETPVDFRVLGYT